MTWRPLLLGAASGLLLWAAHPPLGAWPAAVVGIVVLLEALRQSARDRRGTGFLIGFVAGLLYFGPLLIWLTLPAGYLAWILLASIQATFVGLFTMLLRPAVERWWVVIAAPLLWTGLEAWSGVIPLGGFDWGAIGYAHADGSWMLPMARILGVRGITLATVALAAFAYDAVRRGVVMTEGLEGPAADRVRAMLPHMQPALLGLAGTAVVTALLTVEPPPTTGRELDVAVIQGNDLVDFRGSGREEDQLIAEEMVAQTRAAVAAAPGRPDLTVWPESSIDRDPFQVRGEDLRPYVEEAAEETGGNLLLGTNLDGPRPRTYYNVSVLLGADAEPQDRYVKRHLVPFGEYVPWRDVLGEYPPLEQVPRDGIPGEGPQPIHLDEVRIATLICFETLFGDLARESVLADGEPAHVLVATTNDASYLSRPEAQQHLDQSRLRAVETGRWVVHAALSGTSAIVDPHGVVLEQTELTEATFIRRSVPLVAGRTPFLVIGDVVGIGTRVVVALAFGWWLWRRFRDRRGMGVT